MIAMEFSESFEFGNSTFMKLESQANHAIKDEKTKDNNEDALDVILESPRKSGVQCINSTRSSKSRCLPIATQHSRVHSNVSDISKRLKFRRSKSDSTLPKNHNEALDNYSEFFKSDFSIPLDNVNDQSNKPKDESYLRVSQIEAAFEFAENDLGHANELPKSSIDKEKFTTESLAKDDSIFANDPNATFSDEIDECSLDKPIFSEDINNIMDSEDVKETNWKNPQDNKEDSTAWQDSLKLSNIKMPNDAIEDPNNIMHDLSSFLCAPKDKSLEDRNLLENELEHSRKIFQEYENPKLNTSGNMSLSSMSPEQLKVTQNITISHDLKSQKRYEEKAKVVNHKQKGNIEINEMEKQMVLTNKELLKSLTAWNLPLSILKEYEKKGVLKMFDWQVECLSNPKVLFDHSNLVYSAPTSAGKTLVSEILLLKTVLERGKKVLLILPFISVVREKMFYLQDLLTAAGYRVEGFFGGYTPPGGFDSINVAICTIEKANSIVNKLLEQGRLDEIGTLIVDEVHLISDPGRGYILELLLAKVLYMSRKYALQIQVITMSATLANVELLQNWLGAELFITDFRPVALREMIKIGNKIYDNSMMILRSITEPSVDVKEPFPSISNDSDHIAQLCMETIMEGCSVVVFCPSKDWCENLAVQLAGAIHTLGKQGGEWGTRVRQQLKRTAIESVKQQLKDIPTGLDSVLEKTVTYGCAFHHAGLTTEERDIIEASFKSGALKIIVATSTLSSGVNLPARRVLIRSPLFGGKQMSSLTYRQMIGRAGRTGKDTLGESILICTESNARVGKELITADLKPISSCLEMDSSTHLKRALLEVIASGVASSKEDIENFVNCTLLSAQKRLNLSEDRSTDIESDPEYTESALEFLIEYEFVRLQTNEETNEQYYVATRLGMACLASSMPPTDGLILFAELQKSRRCFVLESELHAVYLVTPYSVCYQLHELDWLFFLDMWEKLTPPMKKVGELVGVKESFLVRAMRGQSKLDYKLMQIHKRFYTALALQELVNETPINVVALKYKCTRGMLQSLQQMASTFAGIVTSFCNSLQWDTLTLIISQFKERLYFGIHRDLIDLMRLPDLNHKRARALFDADITSLVDLANADVLEVEKVLHNLLSFDSVKQHENENEIDMAERNKARNFFITGKAGLTVGEAAKLLVHEARKFVQYEIGVGNINWSQSKDSNGVEDNSVGNVHMSFEDDKYAKQEQGKPEPEKNQLKNNNSENIKVNSIGIDCANNKVDICIPEDGAKKETEELEPRRVNSSKKEATKHIIAHMAFKEAQTNHEIQLKIERTTVNEKQNTIKGCAQKESQLSKKNIYNDAQRQNDMPIVNNNSKTINSNPVIISKDSEAKSLDSKTSDIFQPDIDKKSSPHQRISNKKRKSSEEIDKRNVSPSKLPRTNKIPEKIIHLKNEVNLKNSPVLCKSNAKQKSLEDLTKNANSPKRTTEINVNEKPTAAEEEKPCTSKKAQRLLRARQLSEQKKQEWANRNNMENDKEANIQKLQNENNQKTSSPQISNGKMTSNQSPNTPRSSLIAVSKPTVSTNNPPSKLPRRSPRNLISSTRIEHQSVMTSPRVTPTTRKPQNKSIKSPCELFADENEEAFMLNSAINEAIRKADNCIGPTNTEAIKSADDEIPSSQQMLDTPSNHTNSPHSSRFFRTLRGTQRPQSPKSSKTLRGNKNFKENNSPSTVNNAAFQAPTPKCTMRANKVLDTKPLNVYNDAASKEVCQTNKLQANKSPVSISNAVSKEPSTSASIELSDLSMENSLLKNPMHLNASHILSCSKVDTDSSSFQSIDIIDICGNQQLFKGAFKELMGSKRIGLCLGLQRMSGKLKPIIGANLLLNQVAAAEQSAATPLNYDFQLDDTNYLSGIGFCISDNVVYYMNMQSEGTCKGLTGDIKCKYLQMLFQSAEHTLLVFDAKEQLKVIRKVLKNLTDIMVAIEDPKVASWLLQPDKVHNLHSLAQQFAPECSALVNLCGSGRGYDSYGLDSQSAIFAKVRCSIESCVTIHILKGQIENLERIGTGQLHKFFKELEMPLQISLCNMEDIGFPTSSDALHKLFQDMVDTMKKLESKIYELHGSRFNIGSSSAVAKVLGLHRKTNGRVSTCKQILEKIDTPISQMIITYRKLSVTLTKNIQPLLKCVQNDRIHGQSITFTSTGRISMTEPNLQNVAKDFNVDIGSNQMLVSCRSAFYPSNAKRCLISSDFCQLEMRILAHLSQDSTLLQVMKSEKDVFVAIAARWNKIAESSVSEQLRNGTKQICYGIVYGMGMRALADALKCTEQEARLVSEQFHAAYPGIRVYTEKVIKFAKNNGYIETITGRRRYLEHINNEEIAIKGQAERQAVNSTIQGSAADIAKSAILRMEKNIIKYRDKLGLSSDQSVRLVLHLHDELIFEVPEDKAKKIAKVLSVTMENCVKLNVPLKVKLKIGKSWGELKEVKL